MRVAVNGPVPAVSVVLPARNPHPAYFPQAVESLLAQTFTDWELVVVEPTGTPGVADILARYPDPRIRLTRAPASASLVQLLDHGVREARAALIARCDAADLLDPDRLRVQAEFLAHNPQCGLVGSAYEQIGPAGERWMRTPPADGDGVRKKLRQINPMCNSSVLVRRTVLDQLGGYGREPDGGEYDLLCRASSRGIDIENIPLVLVRSRVHPGGSGRRDQREQVRASLRVKNRYFRREFTWVDALCYRYEQSRLALPQALVPLPPSIEPHAVAAVNWVRPRVGAALAWAGWQRPAERERTHPALAAPVTLRDHTTDVGVFDQVIDRGEYEFTLDPAPRVIVDAGANVGFATVRYATRYPEARIIAVEPEADNFRLLRKNCAPYPNVLPVQAALWSERRSLVVRDSGEGRNAFQVGDRNGHPGGGQEVPGLTIDQLMADHGLDRIDLLKIDIEGAEKEVFDHAGGWVGRVDGIVTELHDRFKPGCTRSLLANTPDFAVCGARGELVLLLRRGGRTRFVPENPQARR